MGFHFLHAADIHLDSPMRGLSAYEGAPVDRFRHATRDALDALVGHAIESRAAFLVIAGDLYDGDWPDFGTGLFLIRQLERLNREGIRAVVLYGNHDADNRITRSLPWPENAYRFSHQAPETIRFDDLGVALHGQSFASAEVTDNLAAAYPPPLAGRLNIGVLHTALEGHARHAGYAPCSLDQLRNHGYDYWALGHVHAGAVLSRAPWIAFPGNLQGRHIRETGAKGCLSVSVEDGAVSDVAAVPLDVVRWLAVEVDASGLEDLAAVRARADDHVHRVVTAEAQGRPAAVRVTLTGRTPAHGALVGDFDQLEAELQAALLGLSDCWLESVRLKTAPPARQTDPGAAEAAGLLAALLADARTDDELAAGLADALRPLADRLPAELARDTLAGDTEDAPLLAALRRRDMATLIGEVLPDLSALAKDA